MGDEADAAGRALRNGLSFSAADLVPNLASLLNLGRKKLFGTGTQGQSRSSGSGSRRSRDQTDNSGPRKEDNPSHAEVVSPSRGVEDYSSRGADAYPSRGTDVYYSRGVDAYPSRGDDALPKKSEVYTINKSNPGAVLIIDVDHSTDEASEDNRVQDRYKLLELFSDLSFAPITLYTNEDGLTALDILSKIEHFLKTLSESTSAVVICILSNGRFVGVTNQSDSNTSEISEILGAFKRHFHIRDVETLINKTPSLESKPKLLLITGQSEGQIQEDEHGRQRQIDHSDMVVCSCMTQGDADAGMVYKHSSGESDFIQKFAEAVKKRGSVFCITRILAKVSALLPATNKFHMKTSLVKEWHIDPSEEVERIEEVADWEFFQ